MASPSTSLERARQGHGPRVVLVHGFTQTGASWHQIAASLAARFEVCTIDLPGHGLARDVDAGSLEETAALVGAATGRATYVGYSLGGRICLTLALEQPELVERLVLVGASPGIVDASARTDRRLADQALAARLAPSDGSQGLALEAFLTEWLAGPLFAHLDAAQADIASRLENTPAGLAASLRAVGAGTQTPSHERLDTLAMPTLLLAGENDARYAAIAEEMAARIGANARRAVVPDAGHAACFERPEIFLSLLEAFLDAT